MRIPIVCFESAEDAAKGFGVELKSSDLTAGGVSVYSEKLLAIGAKVFLQIFLPGRDSPIDAVAIVRHVQSLIDGDGFKIGAAFTKITDADRADIQTSVDNMNIYAILEAAIRHNVSDVHLTVGRPPMVRKDGTIIPIKMPQLERGQIEAMLFPLLSRKQIARFREKKELNFAFSPTVESRFRINLHLQRGFVEAALRIIPEGTKSFDELALPKATLENFCLSRAGLILIAGTTGSGKTTTLAAMVNHINHTRRSVIVTVEDPIEYTHVGVKSLLKQREVGSDTNSYAEALRNVLRQDPDVIVVGEILDGECLTAALRAAETGHLVISTIHAPSTTQAIERIANFYSPEHAATIRQQLASCLNGIVYQTLMPSTEGDRIAATEVLIATPAAKSLIRDGRHVQLPNLLQTGRSIGMHSLEQDMKRLIANDLIPADSLRDSVSPLSVPPTN